MRTPDDAANESWDRTRRQYLGAIGAGALAGLAGCGGDDSTGDEQGNDDPAATDAQEQSDGDGSTGGEDGCPAPPESYERQTIYAGGPQGENPSLIGEIPSASYIDTIVDAEFGSNQIQFHGLPGRSASLGLVFQIAYNQEAIESVAEDNFDSDQEVTSQFDLAAEGGRIFETVQRGDLSRLVLLVPGGNDDTLYVPLDPSDDVTSCPDLVRAVRDRVVTSIRRPA